MPPELPRLSATADVKDVVHALTEFGGVIVENLLSADTVARVNQEIEPHLGDAAPDRQDFLNPAIAWFFGKRTRHLTAVATHSRSFATEVMCHDTFLGVCDAILGPSCARYQLNLGHVLDRGPGAERQLLHRDELVWVNFPRPHPELQVASMIALGDFTKENGGTCVVPGSHRWEPDRQPEEDEIAVAEMSAGSAVIYLGSTIHAGGANVTDDQRRCGLHLSYVLGWLRTEENHYLATPPKIARTLPRKAQELLGYAAHDAIAHGGGYLGSLDLRDPVDLLQEGVL